MRFLWQIPGVTDPIDDLLKRLSAFRTAKGLSVTELARLISVQPGQLRGWFTGRRTPNARHFAQLQAFLRRQTAAAKAQQTE